MGARGYARMAASWRRLASSHLCSVGFGVIAKVGLRSRLRARLAVPALQREGLGEAIVRPLVVIVRSDRERCLKEALGELVRSWVRVGVGVGVRARALRERRHWNIKYAPAFIASHPKSATRRGACTIAVEMTKMTSTHLVTVRVRVRVGVWEAGEGEGDGDGWCEGRLDVRVGRRG